MYFSSTSYITVCWTDGGAYNGTTCAGIPVTNYYTFCYMEEQHYLLPDEGGGWGGYENNNDIISVNTVVSELQQPCIQNVFNSIGSNNLVNTINSLFLILGEHQKYRFEFKDDWTGGNVFQPAQTTAIWGQTAI